MQGNRAPNIASLYIGDLHPDATEAVLYDTFSAAGPISSIRVCRDKESKQSLGYGYVNYHSIADATRALEKFNYSVIKGRSCRLMWSQRDTGQRKASSSNVYVSSLNPNIDNKALHETFSIFGNILSCKVACDAQGVSFGYGFVNFEFEDDARAAIEKLDGMEVGDKRIQVCLCEKRKDHGAGSHADTFTNLYVKCFPSEWDEEKFRSQFEEIGPITGAAVRTDPQGRKYGFVNFESHEDAKRCVEEMHLKDMRTAEEIEKDAPEEKDLDGHPLTRLYVQRVVSKTEKGGPKGKGKSKGKAGGEGETSLYIKGLSEDVTKATLADMFLPFGPVYSTSVPTDSSGKCKGFGFVTLSSPDAATQAVMQLHLKVVNGKSLHVKLAESKDQRSGQLQRGSGKGYKAGPGLFTGKAVGKGKGAMPGMPMMFPGPHPMMMGACGPPSPMSQMMGGCSPSSPMSQLNAIRQLPGMGPMGSLPSMAPLQFMGPAGGMNMSSSTGPAHPAALSAAPPAVQKQLLGEKLFQSVLKIRPSHAGKITGMLLEMTNSEILVLLTSDYLLEKKVQEAFRLLTEKRWPPDQR
eukprot:TRINITY_DN91262_c0_g1_i1.p1 TRINITY_DN91262_c0_g1~~TRINITY_DN91262_c0_g1_i1.p1  ORF type:complete len:577 (+),score=112.48 TRINITY_DN91262_c0_g1_i1:153-1883(+)